MDVELLYFDGCPNWETADERLRKLQSELGFRLSRRRIETPEEAERVGFRGSPTILVDGVDAFANEDQPIGFSCRIFDTPEGQAGSPSEEQLRRILG